MIYAFQRRAGKRRSPFNDLRWKLADRRVASDETKAEKGVLSR
jgi:hypothetical protein